MFWRDLVSLQVQKFGTSAEEDLIGTVVQPHSRCALTHSNIQA